MIDNFSQKEWSDEVNILASKLCLKKSELARMLGESRFYMAHVLSGTIKVTDSRILTYSAIVPFLKNVLAEDGVFRKDIYEPGRKTAERKKRYLLNLKVRFDIFLNGVFSKENEDAAKTITE